VIILRKINDRIILGLVTGLLGNIPKTILCETFYRNRIAKKRCSDLALSLFLPSYKVSSKKGSIFGIICDYIMSSFAGIGYIYLLTYTGKDYALIKGFLSGIFNFALFRGIFSKIGTVKTYPKDMLTNITMGINSSIWGITTGLLTLLLGNKELFMPKPGVQSNPHDVIQ
jgi:hypothetical protein